MKRVFSFVLSAILLALAVITPLKANAASETSQAGVVSTVSSGLNVRANPSTGAPILQTLTKGSYVTLLSRSGSWWRVEYGKNIYGYCHSDFIAAAQSSPAKVKTHSGNLNVRSGGGTSYSRIGSLAKGETVLVLSSSGGWSKIVYHGVKTGYVSSAYLEQMNTGVKLNVPSFKQTDNRWGSVAIGQSGKTMAKIGCATTAIAMMESYRTGSVIYPDAMMRKLNYTASGDVYWPSHYTTITNSDNFLSNIRKLLEQGKPVLLGAKNTYGSQHWVVVTGFSGNGASASDFIINDPGSSSRTNLQQFLSVYPNFYKYFHY